MIKSRKSSRKLSKKIAKTISHGYKDKPFLKYSRLPRIDRKFCSCVMMVRHRKFKTKDSDINPYAVCTYSVYQKRNKKKSINLDCGINYDLDNYNEDYIKAYAKERKIPLTYVNRDGKRVKSSKKSLINKLRNSMIKKKVDKNRTKRIS